MHDAPTQYTSCISPFVLIAGIVGFRRLQLPPALNRAAASLHQDSPSSRRAVTRLLVLQLLLGAVALNRLWGPPPLVTPQGNRIKSRGAIVGPERTE